MKKKIFIGPSEIAGYYNNLHQGFLLIDENAEFISYEKHPFEYNNTISKYWFIRSLNYFNSKKNESKNIFFHKKIKKWLKKIATLTFLFRFDVFIFSFG